MGGEQWFYDDSAKALVLKAWQREEGCPKLMKILWCHLLMISKLII